MRLLGRLLESRATTYQQVWGADGDWDRGGTWGGKAVTRDSMLGLSAVFACVRFIVDAISTLPLHDFGPEGEAPEQPDWLDRPVPADPSTTLIVHLQQVVSSLLIEGNSFTFADPDVTNPAELRVLDPRKVDTKRGRNGAPIYRVDNIEYDWSNIIHIPLIRLPGEMRGLAPLEAERQTFSAAIAAEEYGARFLGNGTSLGGVIEMPAGVDVDDDQAKALVDKFELRYSGSKNAHRPGLLTGGAIWKPLSVTPEQAQFLETRQYDDERIFRIFRVPPALAGMVREGATSNASSVSQALAFEKHTIRPLVTLIEEAYRPLVPPGHYLKFSTKGLLRGDPKTQADIYHLSLTDKWQTVDEVRGLEDMVPLGGEDGGLLETPNNNAPGLAPVVVAEPEKEPDVDEANMRALTTVALTALSDPRPSPVNVTVHHRGDRLVRSVIDRDPETGKIVGAHDELIA
jgi:HK97 family phage portal protein